MYLSCELAHSRVIGLETFWNELFLVEIKVNRDICLIDMFIVHGQQTLSSLILPIKKI